MAYQTLSQAMLLVETNVGDSQALFNAKLHFEAEVVSQILLQSMSMFHGPVPFPSLFLS